MYNFFVLGQVPGTNITISFAMWVELCAALTVIAFWFMFVRKRTAPTPTSTLLDPSSISTEATA